MKMAYEEAVKNYIQGGNNRIITCTDGDFNVGVSSTDELVEMVESYLDKGIYLSVMGFGVGNFMDGMMEQISNHGNGKTPPSRQKTKRAGQMTFWSALQCLFPLWSLTVLRT